MAQISYRANLASPAFPFLSELGGQTVIVPGPDQNYIPYVTSQSDLDMDRGFPQLLYAHNVMPTAQGYQSVGYNERIPAIPGVNFSRSRPPFSGYIESQKHIYIHTNGDVYVSDLAALNSENRVWNLIQNIAIAAGSDKITSTYIDGTFYIYISTLGCYKYDPGISQFVSVTLVGLVPGAISGILSVAGQMIAYGANNNIAWSSVTDPEDFTPSLVTGAGGGTVQEVEGSIVHCEPINLGFIIYCTGNIIASISSNNIRYPFTIKELVSSGGFDVSYQFDPRLLIAATSTGDSHIALTTKGIQQITTVGCKNILPELNAFLCGKYIDEFNTTTLDFFRTYSQDTPQTLHKAISLVSSRFVVFSYSTMDPSASVNAFYYTHAIVFDQLTERFGKIKFNHKKIIEYSYPNARIDSSVKSIGFVGLNLEVHTVNLDIDDTSEKDAVAIFGKYQLLRTNFFDLCAVCVENVEEDSDFTCHALSTLDGKNVTQKPQGYPQVDDGLLREYSFDVSGKNHMIVFQGSFNIVSFELVGFASSRR